MSHYYPSPRLCQVFGTHYYSLDIIQLSSGRPCDGLADAIERQDTLQIAALCADYTKAMGKFGTAPGEMDTLVLGCTHYPFAEAHLRALLGSQVQLIDSGVPVARQTRRLLQTHAMLARNGKACQD